MTELQFLIDLLLNHKLNVSTKKLVADRIGQVESQYSKSTQPTVQTIINPTPKLIHGAIQAASTQAILDRQDEVPNSTQVTVAPPPPVSPSSLASNRIVGGEVNTGRGSRGPRKF